MNDNIWIAKTDEPAGLYKYRHVSYKNTIWYLIGKKVKLPPVCERQWETIEMAFKKLYKECYPEKSYKLDDRFKFLMYLFNNESPESEITSTNEKRVSKLEKEIDRYLKNVGKTLKILPYRYQLKARCLISKTVEDLEMLAHRHNNPASSSP